MADLPDEITEEILVRLPASSLLRFKLACKHWQSSISDPNFVGKHLSHVLSLDLDDQSNNNHHKLIIFNSTTASALHSIDYESFNDAATTKQLHIVSASWVLAMACYVIRVTGKTPIEHKVEIYQLKTNSWRRIEGIPYGLLVFPSHTGGTLVNGSLHWASDSVIGCILWKGFAFCSLLGTQSGMYGVSSSAEEKDKVEIYLPKTNSWRRMQGVPHDNVVIAEAEDGTLVNKSFYWDGKDFDNEDNKGFDNLILAFDFIDEKFKLLGVPRDDDIQPKWGRNLVEVRGSLGLYIEGRREQERILN
ncbi:hypothetical protein LguiB_025710 [Lonicera macranthoides]